MFEHVRQWSHRFVRRSQAQVASVPSRSVYEAEFKVAHTLAKELGYDPGPLNLTSDRYLTSAGTEALFTTLAPLLRGVSPEQAAGACVQMAQLIQPHVEKIFGCRAQITLGYVHYEGSDLFKFSASDLERWRREGVPKEGALSLHAWITLPSTEIIDISLPSTIAVTCNQPQLAGRPILKHPSEFTGNMNYHPVIIGLDALINIPGATALFVGYSTAHNTDAGDERRGTLAE